MKKEIFESGKIETLSKMGAKIYIYDKERTICDIIKNKEKRPLLLIFDSEIYVLMAFSLLIDSKL